MPFAASRFTLTSLAALLLLSALPPTAAAHPHHHEAEDSSAPAADFLYDHAEVTVESRLLDHAERYDADVVSMNGQLCHAWLQFTPGQGDQIWASRRSGGRLQEPGPVVSDFGSYARPTLTVDSEDALWLSYEAEREGQWDVLAVPLKRQGEAIRAAGRAERVSPGLGADIRHRVASDPLGGLWFVWQSDNDGQFDVFARRRAGGQWQEPVRLSDNPNGDWHPQVAVDSEGDVFVAWDGLGAGGFDVYVRSRQDDRWGRTSAAAQTAAFESRADLAIDHQDRVWLAWEEGGENWGRPYRGILTPTIGDQSGPLHRFRKLHVALLRRDGGLQPLRDTLPMPSLERAAARSSGTAAKRTGAFYERARLCVDRDGRLWLAYRHFYAPWLGYKHKSHVEQGWAICARYYGQQGWSPLHQFSVGQGDGLQRLELARAGQGIAAVWTTGRTDRRTHSRPRGVVTAEVRGSGQPASEPAAAQTRSPTPPTFADVRSPRPAVNVGGQAFQLFRGDLHRHTDLSLCRVPIDGTIDDAYRYAIEVARLDFLGITDHSRDIALGSALSQLWWRSRKEVRRHQLGTTFLPFFAYERSHGNTADHNVVSLRGDMLRPHTCPVPQFWTELNHEETITIPHQPIRRDTWKYQNDLLRPLLEIYQGCRDASIEPHAHQGLGKGYRLGFIASSDHMSTSASYACVWAAEATRESIFRGLRARRTFGATAGIELTVRAGGHWMGGEVAAERFAKLHLRAAGAAPIRSVELIVDGKVERTFTPGERRVELDVPVDMDGRRYAYFHLLQVDGNQAWSSPLFVRRK